MKKNLIILLLALLGVTQLSAQEGEYIPFVREGVKWVCYFNSYYCFTYHELSYGDYYSQGRTNFTLELKGDTVINGKTYKKMHKYSGDHINAQNDTIPVCLREEDRIVYGIMPNPSLYYGIYVGYGMEGNDPAYNIFRAARSGEEFILYNFNDPDTYYNNIYAKRISSPEPDRFNYLGCDEIPLGNKMARRYRFHIDDYLDCFFIEGVGFDGYYSGYTLGYWYLNKGQSPCREHEGFFLSHVEENGKIIYKGINYEQVMPWDGRMPIVQEGKIWVNERIVINKGDTTRSYYCYEIKGNDPRYPRDDMKQCHYYPGAKIDSGNDSIISLLQEYTSLSIIESRYNWPLLENTENKRNLLAYSCDSASVGNELYEMYNENEEMTISWVVGRQLRPKVLTTENFIAVDPIEIDGFMCERYAYVNEQGEPQAYLVEGIGFDSRCMGDLLTPFTREPDHDADYQEYCGLSHVIKDGKIIYKGMCYNERNVEALAADVNGDGVVNISDVTTLIEMILHEGPSHIRPNGDINQNGETNISDVTTLIDLIMSE
ncbi:MAG: hypothetical protein IJG42_14120 [Muribaculaceae bacterium]|nr:hypothetical protein [Muribaculaceae bacterium]